MIQADMTTNKEIREKVLEVLKRHYNDYPNYTEYDAMNNNPTPDEVFVDQIMQIVEEEVLEERESKCSKNCMHMPDCPNYNRTPVLC